MCCGQMEILKSLMQRVLVPAQPVGLQSNQRCSPLYLPQCPLQWPARWVSCLQFWQRPRLLIFVAELLYVQQHLLLALQRLQLQPVR